MTRRQCAEAMLTFPAGYFGQGDRCAMLHYDFPAKFSDGLEQDVIVRIQPAELFEHESTSPEFHRAVE